MQRKLNVAVALVVALVVGACADPPTGPSEGTSVVRLQPRAERGTGLVINSLTGLELPLIGEVGEVVIDQAVVTRLILVEDVAGNIVGLQAEGALRLTGGILGTEVITEDFVGQVLIASSGRGRCDLVTVDLGPITLDALQGAVSVDVPQAAVTPRPSGALAPLLCALGQVLEPPLGAVTAAARGLVNAINNLLI